MPKPNKGEKQSDYIKRCIPTVLNEGTTSDSKQAAAICYSMWKQHHKQSKGESYLQEAMEEFLNNELEEEED